MEKNPQFRFKISQWTLGYILDPEVLHFPVNFFGAFLFNHAATKHTEHPLLHETPGVRVTSLFGGKAESIAWYAGFTAGALEKKGDWAFEVTYQSVGAQSVPDWDMSGIGTGNPQGYVIYRDALSSVATIPDDSGFPYGNVNFRGWDFNFSYLVTTNINVLLEYQFSREKLGNLKPAVDQPRPFPGDSDYHCFMAEILYSF
jgi:hypothetical protein